MKAVWNGVTIAESNATVVVEGNHYFPPDSVQMQYLTGTDTHTTCSWKGECSYYTVTVEGESNTDAAWYYPQPLEEAQHIAGYVAFWKGVEVVE